MRTKKPIEPKLPLTTDELGILSQKMTFKLSEVVSTVGEMIIVIALMQAAVTSTATLANLEPSDAE